MGIGHSSTGLVDHKCPRLASVRGLPMLRSFRSWYLGDLQQSSCRKEADIQEQLCEVPGTSLIAIFIL